MKAKPYKRRLNQRILETAKPRERAYLIWDEDTSGLAVCIYPSGKRSWVFIYSRGGRSRWYKVGRVDALGLADARREARELRVQVDKGVDVQAEKKAQRAEADFETLASEYLEQYAKKRHKSWQQADYLVCKHLLPRWGKLQAASISRDDVKALMRSIEAKIVANSTLAAASAIFSWAIEEGKIKVNPCSKIKRNPVVSRERVLSDSELPQFWQAFDKAGVIGKALKLILLLGQRPGEIVHMRREHIRDQWWELPGKPTENWPGTKNGANHRVWLPQPVLSILGALQGDGFVLACNRGQLDQFMRDVCRELGVNEKATPHDLRRTHGTKVTGLGFGRDAMNRIQNHKEGGIGSVYDRHGYAEENKRVMEMVAANIIAVIEGRASEKVVAFRK